MMNEAEFNALEAKLFNTAGHHLLNQNQRSTIGGNCRYRVKISDDCMLMCAVGALIDDDHYKPDFESHGILTEVFLAVLGTAGHDISELTEDQSKRLRRTLARLQSVHDGCRPSEWSKEISSLSVRLGIAWQGETS